MLDIVPDLIIAKVIPLEIEIPFLMPITVALSMSIISWLGYYDIKALRAYILFSLFIFGALGLRVRYEYLWLRSMGIYVHEYMDVDDEELFS